MAKLNLSAQCENCLKDVRTDKYVFAHDRHFCDIGCKIEWERKNLTKND